MIYDVFRMDKTDLKKKNLNDLFNENIFFNVKLSCVSMKKKTINLPLVHSTIIICKYNRRPYLIRTKVQKLGLLIGGAKLN